MRRKIYAAIIIVFFLAGSGVIPPLMNIWNRPGFLGPIPYYFAGCWIIGGVFVVATWIINYLERNDTTLD